MPNDAPPTEAPTALVVPSQFPTFDAGSYPLLAAARSTRVATTAPVPTALGKEMSAAAAAVLADMDAYTRVQRLAAKVVQRTAKELAAQDPPVRFAEYRKRAYRLQIAMEVLLDDMLGDTPDDERMEHIQTSMSEYANEMWLALRDDEEKIQEARDKARRAAPPVAWLALPELVATGLVDEYNTDDDGKPTARARELLDEEYMFNPDADRGCKVPLAIEPREKLGWRLERWYSHTDGSNEFRVAAAITCLKVKMLNEAAPVWKKATDNLALIAEVNQNVDAGHAAVLADLGKVADDSDAKLELKTMPAWLNKTDLSKVPSADEAAAWAWNQIAQANADAVESQEFQDRENAKPGSKWEEAGHDSVQFTLPKDLEWGQLADRIESGYWGSVTNAIEEGYIAGPDYDYWESEGKQIIECIRDQEEAQDEDDEDYEKPDVKVHVSAVLFTVMGEAVKKESDIWLKTPEELEGSKDIFVAAYELVLADAQAAKAAGTPLEDKQEGGAYGQYATKMWNLLVRMDRAPEVADEDADDAEADDADDSDDEMPEALGKITVSEALADCGWFATVARGKKAAGGIDAPISDKLFGKIEAFATVAQRDTSEPNEVRVAAGGLLEKAKVLCIANKHLWADPKDGAAIIAATNEAVDAGYALAVEWLADLGDAEIERRGPPSDAADRSVPPAHAAVPTPEVAAQRMWDGVAAAVERARKAEAREKEKEARLPGKQWTGGMIRFPLTGALHEAVSSLDADWGEPVVRAVADAAIEGPLAVGDGDTLTMAMYNTVDDSEVRPQYFAPWEALQMVLGHFRPSSEFWFEDHADVMAMPALLASAYDLVMAELATVPEGEELEPKEDDIADTALTQDFFVRKLWNRVFDKVRVHYEDTGFFAPYTGKRVPISLPAEVLEHPKLQPLLANYVVDGQLGMPCSKKLTTVLIPALEAVIADIKGETRRMRAAAMLAKWMVTEFGPTQPFTWQEGYAWAVNFHANYQKAYGMIVGWVDEVPADEPLEERAKDFEGIDDVNRLWGLMWEELVESEQAAAGGEDPSDEE